MNNSEKNRAESNIYFSIKMNSEAKSYTIINKNNSESQGMLIFSTSKWNHKNF